MSCKIQVRNKTLRFTKNKRVISKILSQKNYHKNIHERAQTHLKICKSSVTCHLSDIHFLQLVDN